MAENITRETEFGREARRYGVGVQTVSPGEVAETVRELLDAPAIGTAMPWEDVELPDAIETNPTPADIEAAVTGVTAASLAIAEYGSIVLRSDAAGSEPVSLFNDRHIAVLRQEDIVPDMAAAFEWFGEELRQSRDSAIIATGPSATADMGSLVQGAHGPKEVEVIVVE